MKQKRPYEKPSIVPHVSGLMNKIGKSSLIRYQSAIDHVSIQKLMEEHGSPLFVFSERKLRESARRLKQAFTLRYPRVRFAWSYKTNYLRAICATLHQEGWDAEVVSEFEYDKARRLGIPGKRIIFNGPCKSLESLERAVREEALIFIDNFDELHLLTQIGRTQKKKPNIGIRLNLDCGIFPAWGRFGFNLESGQAEEAVQRIQKAGCFMFQSLHCHIGTFILDPNAYAIQVEKMFRFAQTLKSKHNVKITTLDLGGGFASKNTLHTQYAAGETANPSYETYAEAISQKLASFKIPEKDLPTIVLETGRGLVDDCGYLLTSVTGTKRLPDGSRSLIIDAGVNLLYTAAWYKHEMIPAEDYGDFMESCSVYGPLCMNIDIIRPQVMLPVLKPGNRLIIHPVGAYCVTQWMQFIHLRPAIVLVDEKSKVHLIRERETVEIVEQLERLPGHLDHGF